MKNSCKHNVAWRCIQANSGLTSRVRNVRTYTLSLSVLVRAQPTTLSNQLVRNLKANKQNRYVVHATTRILHTQYEEQLQTHYIMEMYASKRWFNISSSKCADVHIVAVGTACMQKQSVDNKNHATHTTWKTDVNTIYHGDVFMLTLATNMVHISGIRHTSDLSFCCSKTCSSSCLCLAFQNTCT